MSKTSTLGEIMERQDRESLVKIIKIAAAVVYIGGIVTLGAFNFRLITNNLTGLLAIFAGIGLVLVHVSALLYPLAYQYWTAPGWHRSMCVIFYALDMLILTLNAIVEFNIINYGAPPAYLAGWVALAPLTILFPPIAWGILWHMDPINQEHDLILSLQTSTREAIAKKVAAYAKDDATLDQEITRAAEEFTRSQVWKVLDDKHSAPPALAAPVAAFAATVPAVNGKNHRMEVHELSPKKN